MATRESVDNLISQANACISEAENQLDITNRNGYEIDSAYSEAQRKLADMEQEIQKLMDSASHQQRDQLHRVHLAVSQHMNDMVLDRIQMDQSE
ncbi:DUF2524 family protein [Aquibacillus rhizosphaerae]|uniref:DUF2524 family protein n=1 Tax=Aquibacillus rhizosphaerae TaxID=3051431 RepID=A0ABT7L9N5_9BACI|nr:DUF2524 family protein [Aquibacillus sp. LR5S19]MDL4842580.1 DUF2524 family protein [Aquibacillus sp. LR5S19]